jgi:hypothetical protein
MTELRCGRLALGRRTRPTCGARAYLKVRSEWRQARGEVTRLPSDPGAMSRALLVRDGVRVFEPSRAPVGPFHCAGWSTAHTGHAAAAAGRSIVGADDGRESVHSTTQSAAAVCRSTRPPWDIHASSTGVVGVGIISNCMAAPPVVGVMSAMLAVQAVAVIVRAASNAAPRRWRTLSGSRSRSAGTARHSRSGARRAAPG